MVSRRGRTHRVEPAQKGLQPRPAAERAHERSGDQTGEATIHGYGEGLDPNGGLGKHYSAPTLITRTRRADAWSTLWGAFEVDAGIRKLSFEIRQADGSTAKTGSASCFSRRPSLRQ
jgi:hypothetical protein